MAMEKHYILDDCFNYPLRRWLMNSNHKKAKKYWKEMHGWKEGINPMPSLDELNDEAHEEILQALKNNPDASYFWYDANGRLTFVIPDDRIIAVPGDSLRPNKEKIKEALREIKLSELLDEQKQGT